MAIRVGFVLVVAAVYVPLRVLISNHDKFPHLERFAAIVAVYLVLAVVFFVVARRLGAAHLPALFGSAVWIVLLSSGRNLAVQLPWSLALVLTLIVAAMITFIVGRLPDGFQRIAPMGFALFLLAGLVLPALDILEDISEADVETAVATPRSSLPESAASTPDVFLIVLDGMVGDAALRTAYGVEGGAPQHNTPTASGWSSYPVSLGSMSSVLNMDHTLEAGSILDGPTRSQLAEIISGDNRATTWFKEAGYETTLVESGWSRSYCGSAIDTCVDSAFLDEGIFEVVRQSVLGTLLEKTLGSALTIGAQHSMEWLLENTPRITSDETPDFVFATVLVPHPPLFLDSECEFRYDPILGGNGMYIGGLAAGEREAAYLEQFECAQLFEATFLQVVEPDDVVLIISDHGSDKAGQLTKQAEEWTLEDRVERLNVRATTQLPDGCEEVDPLMLVDVLRRTLFCLAGIPNSQPLEHRIFISSLVDEPKVLLIDEMTGGELVELLDVGR